MKSKYEWLDEKIDMDEVYAKKSENGWMYYSAEDDDLVAIVNTKTGEINILRGL